MTNRMAIAWEDWGRRDETNETKNSHDTARYAQPVHTHKTLIDFNRRRIHSFNHFGTHKKIPVLGTRGCCCSLRTLYISWMLSMVFFRICPKKTAKKHTHKTQRKIWRHAKVQLMHIVHTACMHMHTYICICIVYRHRYGIALAFQANLTDNSTALEYKVHTQRLNHTNMNEKEHKIFFKHD